MKFITRRSTINFLKRLLGAAIVVSCSMLVMFAFFLLGPIVEGKFFPVVTDIDSVRIVPQQKLTRIVFEGTKIRACELIEVSALTGTIGQLRQANLFFEDIDEDTPRTRPPGHQMFGPWAVYPAGEQLIIVAYHRCHPLWQTITPLIYWQNPTVK